MVGQTQSGGSWVATPGADVELFVRNLSTGSKAAVSAGQARSLAARIAGVLRDLYCQVELSAASGALRMTSKQLRTAPDVSVEFEGIGCAHLGTFGCVSRDFEDFRGWLAGCHHTM